MGALSVVFFFLAIGIGLGVVLGLILGAGPFLKGVFALVWSILMIPFYILKGIVEMPTNILAGYRQATNPVPAPIPASSVSSPLTNVYRNHNS